MKKWSDSLVHRQNRHLGTCFSLTNPHGTNSSITRIDFTKRMQAQRTISMRGLVPLMFCTYPPCVVCLYNALKFVVSFHDHYHLHMHAKASRMMYASWMCRASSKDAHLLSFAVYSMSYIRTSKDPSSMLLTFLSFFTQTRTWKLKRNCALEILRTFKRALTL